MLNWRAVRALLLCVTLLRYGLIHRRRLYRLSGRRARDKDRGFVLAAMRRFRDLDLIAKSEPFALALQNQLWRSHSFEARLDADFRGGMTLRLAECLKACGWFEDAELLLREVARRPVYSDLAWLSLGDLFLTESNWRRDFESYQAIGAALDAFAFDEMGPAWRSRLAGEAVDALRLAIAAAPDDPTPWLLLTMAERRRHRWAAARAAAEAFDIRQPAPNWDERMTQAGAALARDHVEALRLCSAACATQVASLPGHGFEAWRSQVVEVRDTRCAPVLARSERLSSRRMTLNGALVRNGLTSEYSRELAFKAVDVTRFAQATVLPSYGMILVDGDILLRDSAHVLDDDFPLYTPHVRAIAEGHALLCGVSPVDEPAAGGGVFLGENANYYHFLIDELPRLQLLDEIPEYSARPLIIDRRARAWQIDLLGRLGYTPDRLLSVDLSRPVRLADVVVPGRMSGRMLAHPQAVAYLRAKLAPKADAAHPQAGKRVYLSRPGNVRRGMLNERAVIERLRRAGFVFVDPGEMTIDQQIEFFADVDVLVGPGGAAFTNLIYAPRSAKALFLTPPDVAVESFTTIAGALGQTSAWCAGYSYPRPHPAWIWSIFDFEIDLNDLEKALEFVL